MVRAARDPDAGRHDELMPAQHHRLLDGATETLCKPGQFGAGPGSGKHEREVIPAEGREVEVVSVRRCVLLPFLIEHGLEAHAGFDQGLVTDLLAQRIVDTLESVDIDGENRNGTRIALECTRNRFPETRAVG